MDNKWRLAIVAILLLAVAAYQWVSTAPTWTAYHRCYGMVMSLDEFDVLMTEIEDDVAANFHKHSINATQARKDISFYLDDDAAPIVDKHGNYGYVDRFEVNAWVWVWDGADMTPEWNVVGEWRDTWRTREYKRPEAKQAHFSMMGLAAAPAP